MKGLGLQIIEMRDVQPEIVSPVPRLISGLTGHEALDVVSNLDKPLSVVELK